MMKFIHFVIDDKFIPDSIKCFEEAGLTNNEFYYVRPKSHPVTEYLDLFKVKELNNNEVISLLEKRKPCVVVLHSLYSLPLEIINHIPNVIKIIWYAWGFDLYSNPRPLNPLVVQDNRYGIETRSFIDKFNRKTYVDKFRYMIKRLLKKGYTRRDAENAVSRIDYFAGVFQEEYDLLCKRVPYFRAKKIVHNYIHPQEFLRDDINEPISVKGNNILLGNSATINCNHLDLLTILGTSNLKDIKIYCPLSYQGTKDYKQAVVKKGEDLFGENFIPLMDFLPLSEYNQIMNSCGSLILGQMQQAATCNILTAIWSGIKVYLPEDSMNYIHYMNEGLKVYPLDSINSRDVHEPRTEVEVKESRTIIEKYYSYRQWKEDLAHSLFIINNDLNTNN